MYLKKLFIIFFICYLSVLSVYGDERIEAQRNAYRHNNKGLLYLQDKYYFGAIKEFEIAINLLPDSQASATFYYNLGNTYEIIGYPQKAKPCFEKALKLNVHCFDYYLKVVENYKKLGFVEKKLTEIQNKSYSPFNDILIGLLYIQKGDVSAGVTTLDLFCEKEPNLLVTSGVRKYLEKITQEKL